MTKYSIYLTIFLMLSNSFYVKNAASSEPNKASIDLKRAEQLVATKDLRAINMFLKTDCMSGTKRPKEACLIIISEYAKLQTRPEVSATVVQAYLQIGEIEKAQFFVDSYKIANPENSYVSSAQAKIDQYKSRSTNRNLKYVVSITDPPKTTSPKQLEKKKAFSSSEKSKLARQMSHKEISIIKKTPSRRSTLGYAVAITTDGHLVTPSSVISGLNEVLVYVPGHPGGGYTAQILMEEKDVTVLKIEPKKPLVILPTKTPTGETPVGVVYDNKILDGFLKPKGEFFETTIEVPKAKKYKIIPNGSPILTTNSEVVGVAIIKGDKFVAAPIDSLKNLIEKIENSSKNDSDPANSDNLSANSPSIRMNQSERNKINNIINKAYESSQVFVSCYEQTLKNRAIDALTILNKVKRIIPSDLTSEKEYVKSCQSGYNTAQQEGANLPIAELLWKDITFQLNLIFEETVYEKRLEECMSCERIMEQCFQDGCFSKKLSIDLNSFNTNWDKKNCNTLYSAGIQASAKKECWWNHENINEKVSVIFSCLTGNETVPCENVSENFNPSTSNL